MTTDRRRLRSATVAAAALALVLPTVMAVDAIASQPADQSSAPQQSSAPRADATPSTIPATIPATDSDTLCPPVTGTASAVPLR